MFTRKRIILIALLLVAIALIVFVTSNKFWGDNPLGNRFSLLEGDCKEDRIIVYCTNKDRICSGGMYVIPTYKRHINAKGEYAEYVEDAESNDRWIVAKTIQIAENKANYWILDKNFSIENTDCEKNDCDSIIQSHVIGPLSFEVFKTELKKLNIDIEFE